MAPHGGVFHVKHEGSTPERPPFSLGISLSDEQVGQLERFEALLTERAIPSGFIAAADAPRVRERHIWDSLRAAAVIRLDEDTAYDLGSGAGLPGLVVAIACPWLEITLVEARRPRVAFLELALERLTLTNAQTTQGGRRTSVIEPTSASLGHSRPPPQRGEWQTLCSRLEDGSSTSAARGSIARSCRMTLW